MGFMDRASPLAHVGWARLESRVPKGKSLNLDDQVDFDGDVEWKRCGAEGGAGVFAFFAEDLDEEFGGAVDDLWVAVEIGIGVYEAVE